MACRTNPLSVDYNEAISVRTFISSVVPSGLLYGIAAFNRDFTLMGGICTYFGFRIDATDPGVPACPAP